MGRVKIPALISRCRLFIFVKNRHNDSMGPFSPGRAGLDFTPFVLTNTWFILAATAIMARMWASNCLFDPPLRYPCQCSESTPSGIHSKRLGLSGKQISLLKSNCLKNEGSANGTNKY
jgi:hypothetical protein